MAKKGSGQEAAAALEPAVTNGARAEIWLRSIVAAYTAGDADELERLIEKAGDWLAELKEGDPDVEEPAAAEEEGADSRPAQATPPARGISPVVPIGAADAAFVRLYNAAKRLLAQGPSSSTNAELEAAVRAVEPLIVR